MLLFHKLNSTKKSKTRTKFCAIKPSNQVTENETDSSKFELNTTPICVEDLNCPPMLIVYYSPYCSGSDLLQLKFEFD